VYNSHMKHDWDWLNYYRCYPYGDLLDEDFDIDVFAHEWI